MGATVAPEPDARLVPAALAGWAGAWVGTAGARTAVEGPGWAVGGPGPMLVLGVAAVSAAAVTGVVGSLRSWRAFALLLAIAAVVGGGAMLAGQGRVSAQAAGPMLDAAEERSQGKA